MGGKVKVRTKEWASFSEIEANSSAKNKKSEERIASKPVSSFVMKLHDDRRKRDKQTAKQRRRNVMPAVPAKIAHAIHQVVASVEKFDGGMLY